MIKLLLVEDDASLAYIEKKLYTDTKNRIGS